MDAQRSAPNAVSSSVDLRFTIYARTNRMHKQWRSDAADDAAGVHAQVLGGLGVIPIGERSSIGRLVCELVDAGRESIELSGRVGHRCCPEEPVCLYERGSVIERRSVRVSLGEVARDLIVGDRLWEEPVSEELVPHEVVLDAPRPCLAES